MAEKAKLEIVMDEKGVRAEIKREPGRCDAACKDCITTDGESIEEMSKTQR